MIVSKTRGGLDLILPEGPLTGPGENIAPVARVVKRRLNAWMANLNEGSKAPNFSLTSDDGKKVSLADFKGKYLVLYFYPKDLTSGCTTQACDFRDNLAGLKKLSASVVGVSKDPIEQHQKFRDKYDLNFPLLADDAGKACEAYGVWKEKSMYGRKYMGIERTTFIIGPDSKILKIFPKVKVKDQAKAVSEAIAAAKKNSK
jgi:thioredoxin-dependent peroxiredoxin